MGMIACYEKDSLRKFTRNGGKQSRRASRNEHLQSSEVHQVDETSMLAAHDIHASG